MLKFNKYRRLFQANSRYYTASSVRGQGQPNTPLWLATQADKMELSCLLGIASCLPRKKVTLMP